MFISYIRAVILYLLLILAVRLMGKRQVGGREPAEFVVAILIADLASVPMQDIGIPLLSGILPILTVLGLVYYLFQHEFFLTAVILSGSIFTLWVCQKGLGTPNWNTKVIVGSAAVLLGLAAVAALTRQIEKNKGRWIGKRKVRLFSVNCPYPALYLTYGLAFAAIVLSLAVGGAAYYAIWVLGIFFFGMAVYYTTKLM